MEGISPGSAVFMYFSRKIKSKSLFICGSHHLGVDWLRETTYACTQGINRGRKYKIILGDTLSGAGQEERSPVV